MNIKKTIKPPNFNKIINYSKIEPQNQLSTDSSHILTSSSYKLDLKTRIFGQ